MQINNRIDDDGILKGLIAPSPETVSGISKLRSCLAMVYHTCGSVRVVIVESGFINFIALQNEPKDNHPVVSPPHLLSKYIGINGIPEIAPGN